MFSYSIASNDFGQRVLVWIDAAAVVIETLAVVTFIVLVYKEESSVSIRSLDRLRQVVYSSSVQN